MSHKTGSGTALWIQGKGPRGQEPAGAPCVPRPHDPSTPDPREEHLGQTLTSSQAVLTRATFPSLTLAKKPWAPTTCTRRPAEPRSSASARQATLGLSDQQPPLAPSGLSVARVSHFLVFLSLLTTLVKHPSGWGAHTGTCGERRHCLRSLQRHHLTLRATGNAESLAPTGVSRSW